jgi:hypothetical protein
MTVYGFSIDKLRRLKAVMYIAFAGATPWLLRGHTDLACAQVVVLGFAAVACIHRNARDYRRELLALRASAASVVERADEKELQTIQCGKVCLPEKTP